jgi:hypothetical protein
MGEYWVRHGYDVEVYQTITLEFPILRKGNAMLWTILVVLLILWLIGFLAKIGGGLIHLILVVALIVLLIQLVTGRRP